MEFAVSSSSFNKSKVSQNNKSGQLDSHIINKPQIKVESFDVPSKTINYEAQNDRKVRFEDRHPSIISINGGVEWGLVHPEDRYGSLSDNINILTMDYLMPLMPNRRKSSFDRFIDNYGEYVVFEPIPNKNRRATLFSPSKKKFSISHRLSLTPRKSISISDSLF